MAVEELPLETGGDDVLLSVPYDVAWLVIPAVMLVIASAVAVAERRRGVSWLSSFLWFVLILVLPVAGLLIWVIYRVLTRRRSASQSR